MQEWFVLVQREMESRPVFLSTNMLLYGWLDFQGMGVYRPMRLVGA